MGFAIRTLLVSSALFVGMLGALELGRRYGMRWRAARGGREPAAFGTVQGAILGLLGLLVALSFSGAAARFDARRQLVGDEANAVGTAYLRLDALPAAAQPALREAFRRYVDARLAVYRNVESPERADAAAREATALQASIWEQALLACRASDFPAASMLVLPALNEMFDIATTRGVVMMVHPPLVIFVMLAGLALVGAALAGFELAAREDAPWLVALAFSLTMSVTYYVILDLEHPRRGLIRVDVVDSVLQSVRDGMR